MQKKLIAIAVAGALAAPAVALAQTSTVNIYGKITYEYGVGDQGNGRPNVDYADTPGGSAIGFRGEERLGGGLSAWFQCESSADVRSYDQTGFCTRNSAVGFKGAFGNLHFGRWDTPMKRAMNQGTVGGEETGLMGMSFIAFGGSGGGMATLNEFAGEASPGGDTLQRQRWKRREAGLSYYETPNFGGFQALGAFSPGNGAADHATVNGESNAKPRIWSLGVTYDNGPLALGAGYERHNQFGFVGSPLGDLDDKGWGASAAYTFAGKVKVGGTFLRRDWETAPGRNLKKDVWTVGVEWAIAGPHSFEAQYALARDSQGNSLTGIGGNGGATANRACSVGGVNAATGRCASAVATEVGFGDTGANAISLGYRYAFSKRTTVKLAYVRINNDDNTASNRIGNTAALLGNGQTVDSLAFRINHSF